MLLLAPAVLGQSPITYLAQAKPLPKTHWAWHSERDWYAPANRKLAVHVARVMGSVNLHSAWTDGRLEGALDIAQQAGVPLYLIASPWHRHVPAGNPDPTKDDGALLIEIAKFQADIDKIKVASFQANVAIAGIFLDSERFQSTNDARNKALRNTLAGDRWNACIGMRLTLFDFLARNWLPGCKLAWYGAPSGRIGFEPRGPPVDCYVPSLYWPTTGTRNQEMYYRALGASLSRWPDRKPVPILPCVSLGAGCVLDAAGQKTWSPDLSYDPDVSRALGAWLVLQERLDDVFLYPGPSLPTGPTPDWLVHFCAYHRGFMEAAP